MQKTRKRKAGGGRKPQGEFKGSSGNLTIRITLETRQKLEHEAKKNGRSLSQEAQQRIMQSIGENYMREHFDKKHIGAFAFLMGSLAHKIELGGDKTWKKDRYTYLALRSSIDVLLGHLAPQNKVELPNWVKDLALGHKNEKDSKISSLYQNPEEYGAAIAHALLDQLTWHRNASRNVSIMPNDFYRLPNTYDALDRND